jgi:hypothetical protein
MVETPRQASSVEKWTGLAVVEILQEARMKRFISPLVLSFLIGILFSAFSFAGESRNVTILCTGSVKGTIAPCKT